MNNRLRFRIVLVCAVITITTEIISMLNSMSFDWDKFIICVWVLNALSWCHDSTKEIKLRSYVISEDLAKLVRDGNDSGSKYEN